MESNTDMEAETVTRSRESRHDRFRRVASKRTNEILEKIRILGNCSNKSAYDYSATEVAKIFSELHSQLDEAKAKFSVGKRKERFRL